MLSNLELLKTSFNKWQINFTREKKTLKFEYCNCFVFRYSGEFNGAILKIYKVKVALWGFSKLRPFGILYSYPQQVPAFISRGATHHTDARDLYQRRRKLLPMNFISKSVFHENSLGSFTFRKAWTCDIFFYFPSEGRHTEDFPDARKIQRLQLGLNPRTRVPVASMLTTRPPKPSSSYKYFSWLFSQFLRKY